MDDPVQDRLQLAREGEDPGDAFVKHGAEGVDIRAGIDVLGNDLLGAQIPHAPEETAGSGDPRLGGGLGQAEVHDPHPEPTSLLAGHHDVFRLDVAVDHSSRVAVVEGLCDVDAYVEGVPQGQRAVAQKRPEAGPLDDGHHEEKRALVAAHVVDRDDGRVIHLRDELCFAAEARLQLGAQRRRGNQLDRDLAVEDGIDRAVNDSHPAPAQLGDELVPAGERGSDHAGSHMKFWEELSVSEAREAVKGTLQ